MVKNITGEWVFVAKNGHIYRWGVLVKIFELLNVAEIIKMEIPNLNEKGFEYKEIRVNWTLKDGKLLFQNGILDSAAMHVVFDGSIDLFTQEVEAMFLVAPLQTANLIVKKIPVVNYILGGKIVSIPFRVTGTFGNATVIPMAPEGVVKEILGLMKRTLKAPIKIIQPLTQLPYSNEHAKTKSNSLE